MGKKNKPNLGSALIRSRKMPESSGGSTRHTTDTHDDSGKLILQSVTEQDALSEFMSTAELANREFTAEKLNTTTIVTSAHIPGILTDKELDEMKRFQDMNKEFLNIPRRPHWDSSTTPEQLELNEKESFLQWRRQLALLDEKDDKLVLTPYEKNIDVWRQLWRVVERSDVLCQIVDARNPLLFKCDDVEKYVKEIDEDKENLIIVNKADYLTEDQRHYWADYFASRNINVIFWSALIASMSETETEDEKSMDVDARKDDLACTRYDEKVQENDAEEGIERKEETTTMDIENVCDLQVENEGSCDQEERIDETLLEDADACKCEKSDANEFKDGRIMSSNSSVFLRDELIDYFEKLKLRLCHPEKEKITIGMVGFPNVGKSSTINALLGDKKTSVSSTPGKTKHFQTINITKTVCLCDCPGLVFPTFVSTKAEMILNGILPVDQMRDYRPPATLLCKLIPREILESIYGINIPEPGEGQDPNRPPTADEFLSAYSRVRGFMTSHGVPDCSRGARYIIKDFLSGRLLYSEPPPEISKEDFKPVHISSERSQSRRKRDEVKNEKKRVKSKVDEEFFSKSENSAHFNTPAGLRQMGHEGLAIEGKPWKKHFNRNKKEKLRRMKKD